jgi:glycosyltransferase involved in cell wall biosynthesis
VKEIRVVHVITRLCQGGAVNALGTLVEQLPGNYHCQLLYGCRASGESEDSSICSFFDDSALIPSLKRKVSLFADLKAFFQLRRELEKRQPDLVHTHTSKAGVLGRLAAFSLGIPVIHSTHGSIFHPKAAIEGVSRFSGKFFQILETLMAMKTEKILTLSFQEKKDLLTLGVGHEGLYEVLPSPVRVADFEKKRGKGKEIREEKNIPLDKRILLQVGRLSSEKGHKQLLEAFSKGLQGELWLAGEGPLRPFLELWVKEKKIQDRVRFLGHCRDLSNWLSMVDVLILPSHYEGQGLVLIEAMAAGVPVVARAVGGVPEVLQGAGLLFYSEDPEELFKALKSLEISKELEKKQVLAGEKRVEDYRPEVIVSKLCRIYERTLRLFPDGV